jgi:hypothetical protein
MYRSERSKEMMPREMIMLYKKSDSQNNEVRETDQQCTSARF